VHFVFLRGTYLDNFICADAALGQQLWTNEQLLDEWKKIMFTHASSPGMWAAYVGM
jgi:hypothetical protein